MAIYTAILPNGQPYEVQGPEGASAEDIQAAGLQLYSQRNPAPFVVLLSVHRLIYLILYAVRS